MWGSVKKTLLPTRKDFLELLLSSSKEYSYAVFAYSTVKNLKVFKCSNFEFDFFAYYI